MRILISNDDGIHSRGIQALVSELSKIAEIYLVAPDRERSGTGHSITVFEPIKASKIKYPGVKEAWVVAGTPVDCVKLAISRLIKEKIDLVVSGINYGPNLGTDVLYSGTVSAAAEGVIMGVPAIAISLDSYDEDMDFSYAAKFARELVSLVQKNGLSSQNLLNVNVPALAEDKIKGTRITKLGARNYNNLFEERQDPRGNTYFWLGGGVRIEEQDSDCDVCAVQEAYISITPIHLDMTDYKLINDFKDSYMAHLDNILQEKIK